MKLAPALALLLLWAPAARGGTPSPEIQLCLQHFRAGERARAESVLGEMDSLPLYRLELDVTPASLKATGRLQVTYPVVERPLAWLYLRATPNAIGRGHVELSQAKLDGRAVRLEERAPGLYGVRLEPALPVGARPTLELHLAALIPQAQPGNDSLLSMLMGSSSEATDHGAFSGSDQFVSLVGILPMVPRLNEQGEPSAGPAGFGDIALYPPAHVMAAVTVPSGFAVHATGEALGEVPEPDGRTRFSFGAAAVRDFPVFVSQGYSRKTAAVDDVTVEQLFDGADAAAAEKVLRQAAAALTEYQKMFGPFPYKTLRVVEAPLVDGAGGMEFPGLVTLSTSLYRAASHSSGQLGGLAPPGLFGNILEFSVAHEVAHQYFAGLVGSDPIKEPVVDEPLAQYVALLYIERRYGKKAADNIKQQQFVLPYQMYRMQGGPDGAADRSTDAFGSALEYAALVYGKAPLLHAEQRRLLGDAAFLKGLRAYVEQYRYRWSCPDCLSRVLASQNPSLTRALDGARAHWWLERHGDEDLGTFDISSLNLPTGGSIDPATMKMLEDAVRALQGGGP